MNRVKFFIDGFNIYHALDNKKEFHKYKWLDYSKLASLFIRPKDQIVDILYFTAFANWNPDKVNRHRILIKALRLRGVKIVLGQFQKVTKKCHKCHSYYQTFEEKKTDVNIAVELLKSAIKDEFDTAIIVSADSDLVPSIEAVKNLFPSKTVGILIPINSRAELLKLVCDFYMKIKKKHLESSVFPDEINLGQGKMLTKPPTWS